MTTRWQRASRVTVADHVVTGGETNPLNQGGKRRAWKVSEIVVADSRTRMRLVLRGGAADGGDAWLTESFDNKLKLRVLEAH